MSAAAQLHEIVSRHLDTKSQTKVAAFLGVSRQAWSAYLHGRSPRESKIDDWLERCTTAGIEVPPSVAAAIVGRFAVVARDTVTHYERTKPWRSR